MPNDHPPIDSKNISGNPVNDAGLELQSQKDDYYLKKTWKKGIQDLGRILPYFVCFVICLPFVFVVWRYIWLIWGNENKIETIITSVLWTLLIYIGGLATPYLKKIIKNEI